MRRAVVIIVVVLTAAVLLVTVFVTLGKARLERRFEGEVHDLLAETSEARPALLAERDVVALPEPVVRWLRYAGVVGQEHPIRVRLHQVGEFLLSEGRGWMPFAAEQVYTTDPPGYVWVATFRMAPLVSVFGRDRYFHGTGSINMWILNLLPVAQKSGGGLNQGALLRYLNEIMWFPGAAVSRYISWEGLDANAARATITYGGISASATFFFDPEGRLTDMRAERYNDAKDKVLPWSTPIARYGEFAGIRIPAEGLGVWRYESGDFAYIRLRITEVEYNPPFRD